MQSVEKQRKQSGFINYIKHPTFNKEKVHKFFYGSREKQGFIKQFATYALLICIGFVYLYPLLYMISRSFMSLNDLLDSSINWLPSALNTENYLQASNSMDFWKSLRDTAIICGVPTILNVFMCSIIGYGFARFDFPLKKVMMGILIFSFILPSQITMMPLYVMYSNYGILGTIWSYILPAAFGQGLNAQIFILIFYQFYKMVPKVLIEAAQIDGAGYLKSYFRIALPSAKPAMLTVFLFSMVWYWNESYLTEMFVVGLTKPKDGEFAWSHLMVKLKQFDVNFSQQQADMSSGVTMNNNESIQMAGTMLSIIPLLIAYFILQRQFVESIDRTGITGE